MSEGAPDHQYWSAPDGNQEGLFKELDVQPAETGSTDESEKSTLALILSLPVPDIVPEETSSPENTSALPATTLDLEEVKGVLASSETKTLDERIAALLAHAWNAASHIERTIPAELSPFITDNVADWYEDHKRLIIDLLHERTPIQRIYDDTEPYGTSPFLRNAATISDIAWNRGHGVEGTRVELSARLIVLEAMNARQRA